MKRGGQGGWEEAFTGRASRDSFLVSSTMNLLWGRKTEQGKMTWELICPRKA